MKSVPFKILEISKFPDDQLISLLEENVIGTPGKSMLYKHVGVRRKVTDLKDAYFCNLSIRGKLYGTVCFCRRTVFNKKVRETVFYIRYFTFLNEFRSNHQQLRKGKQSKLRDEVTMLMNGAGLEHTDDLLLYAYVDTENIRSKRIIEEFGFIEKGSFRTIPFSRINPKVNASVEKLAKDQQPFMYQLLHEFYANYHLVSFENLFEKGEYFIVKNGDEIVCGVQGIPDQWKIIDLPGTSGHLMLSILPKIPVIRRLFSPDYKFIFLESLYCKPGYEKQLQLLLESVLAHYHAYSGILCLDPSSMLYKMVRHIKPGVVHKIMGEKSIEIVVKASPGKLQEYRAPFFISGFDVL
jgi:hypothetical protein